MTSKQVATAVAILISGELQFDLSYLAQELKNGWIFQDVSQSLLVF